ncbi:TPA: hypothetical protein ACH270_004841 [Klebsiella oxytoca]
MEKAIQRYLADDRQYQDRVAVAISLVEEKGAEYEALCQQRAQLGGWQKIMAICNLWLEHSDFQSKSPASAFSIKVGM